MAAEHATAAPAHQSQLQCMRVDAANTAVDECDRIEKLPLNCTKCEPGQVRRVPLVYHAVADTADPPPLVSINARANPSYRLNYHSDESAAAFVREWCGEQAHQAYRCLVPSAYRADLFRFCALHAQVRGGWGGWIEAGRENVFLRPPPPPVPAGRLVRRRRHCGARPV